MENPSSSSSSSSSSPAEHGETHLPIENEPKALFDKEMKLARVSDDHQIHKFVSILCFGF